MKRPKIYSSRYNRDMQYIKSWRQRYDSNTDDEYDSRKDSWEMGDEPMTTSQRQESDSWRETCRQNRRGGW